MQEGESPGSIPLAGVRGIRFADDVPEPGDGGSPVYLRKRTESRAGLGYGLPRSAPIGQGCSVRRLSSTVQGVFHRLVVRKGYTGPGGDEEMATFACAAGPAWGPLGWA